MAIIIYGVIVAIAVFLLFLDRKKLLYYFIFLYPILPEYLAISFSTALPLFTAARLLLIVLFFALIGFDGVVKLDFSFFRKKFFGKAFLIYLICETVLLFSHISVSGQLKNYIGIILENLLLILVLYTLIDTPEKLRGCLKALLIGSFVVFVMGILEPVTKVNLATTFLDTGSRDAMLMSVYERYGSIRSTFTFGHAIALGIYCIAILPLVMYTISWSRSVKSYLLFEFGLGCLILTMSRGTIIIFAVVFIISMLKLQQKERISYATVLLMTFILAGVVIALSPELFATIEDTILSSLNALGAHFTVNASAGGNENALLSRTAQLSLIPQVIAINPIFGVGAGYLDRINFIVYAGFTSFKMVSVDIEYLSNFIEGGLVEFLGTIILYISIIIMIIRDIRRYRDPLCKAFLFSFISIFLGYLTVAQLTTGRILWTLIALYLAYHKNILMKEI